MSTITRYIPQGRGPCKPFSRLKAGFGTLAAFLLTLTIVAISPRLASAEAGGCADSGAKLSRFAPAVPPRPVTDEPFFDANGDQLRLTNYKGHGLVVNFWATWCAPCVKELPALSRLKDIVANDGIDIIALSLDRGGVPAVRKFMDDKGIANLEILIDKKSKVSRKTRVSGLPTTVLIDQDGVERGRVTGYTEWDEDNVVDFIRRCIGPKKN